MKTLKEEIDEEMQNVYCTLELSDKEIDLVKKSLNRIAKKTAEAIRVEKIGVGRSEIIIAQKGYNEAVSLMESKRDNFFK